MKQKTFYHGTRREWVSGELITPEHPQQNAASGPVSVHLTDELDAAIWDAELDPGDGPGRVYLVEPTGEVEDKGEPTTYLPRIPTMTLVSQQALRVIGEVSDWSHYHGTRAALVPGDLIEPGHTPNFGDRGRKTVFVYFARTLGAATWAAELATGEQPSRIYIVEPTGPVEDDPNLTNKKFRGNPTKSFRSRAPLVVKGEVLEWKGHSPDSIKVMKEQLAKLEQLGVEPIDD